MDFQLGGVCVLVGMGCLSVVVTGFVNGGCVGCCSVGVGVGGGDGC